VPLNIVIKIASASGRPAVKISDNIGKNTGDKATVQEVKQRLGYTEKMWAGGNESTRWGTADQKAAV
jgi:nicotinate phosphoribosyltransferase